MIRGIVRKMKSHLDDPVTYHLPLGDVDIPLNPLLGTPIRLSFDGEIHCLSCGRQIRKSYGQGYCYPCFINGPENSECIIRPELCRAHEGQGRDPVWEREHHLQPHVVYLAVSSHLKVGVTSAGETRTRWVDQGAYQAILLAETPNRYLAGLIEVAMKAYVSDRTGWQKMLKEQEPAHVDLVTRKHDLGARLDPDLRRYVSDDDRITTIHYPVLEPPRKVKSLSFDKTPVIQGTLTGIKGQYLMFDAERVLNVRKHGGYVVALIQDE